MIDNEYPDPPRVPSRSPSSSLKAGGEVRKLKVFKELPDDLCSLRSA